MKTLTKNVKFLEPPTSSKGGRIQALVLGNAELKDAPITHVGMLEWERHELVLKPGETIGIEINPVASMDIVAAFEWEEDFA